MHPVLVTILCGSLMVLLSTTRLEAQRAGGGESAPPPASSVRLTGAVRDTAGRPVSVALVWAGEGHYTITDRRGEFALEGVPPDTIQLVVHRPGYKTASVVLQADPGVTVELAVTLVSNVQQLGTIVVEGRMMSQSLWKEGFYERQRLGSGVYFDEEYVARYGGTVDGLIAQAPSVLVVKERGLAIPSGPTSEGTRCPLTVWIDGVLARWAHSVPIERVVPRDQLLAVEVYPRASQVPSRFQGYVSAQPETEGLASPRGGLNATPKGPRDCGALVIWTKPNDGRRLRANAR